jgi:cytochrome c553
MNAMTQGLTNDDLRAMAAYLAKLPAPQPASGATDAARIEKARGLAEQNRCNFCHNRDYSGNENVPRLAGQREDYLLKSLRGYKDNSRRGYDTQMADVVEPLSDTDFADLAHYLARQK